MRILDVAHNTLRICGTITILAGCGGAQPVDAGAMPQAMHVSWRAIFGVPAPDSARSGLYVNDYSGSGSTVYGYRQKNRGNDPPTCTKVVRYARGVAVDGKGNLIVPQGSGFTAFRGPRMCGRELAQIGLGWEGNAVDAASANAAEGTIAVASIQDGSGYGSVQLCTLKTGCRAHLTNSAMNFVLAVTMANDGDCWAASEQGLNMGYVAVLTYFKGCSGSGETATGYQNTSSGGLDIDKNGNLVSISCSLANCSTPAVYIYSGCKPRCKKIGGPFSLHGTSRYGHISQDSTRLAMADYQFGQVDVYRYGPSAITYLYSFNNGLNSNVVGASYSPRAAQ